MTRYSRFKGHFQGRNAIGKPKKMMHRDIKDAEKQAEIIKNADNKIWERHGWKSGGEIEDDKQKYSTYKRELKANTPKKVNPKVYSLLEDENFHLANRALKENKQYIHTRAHTSDKRVITEGAKVEAEHEKTIKEIKKSNVSIKEAERKIAADHIKEDKNYYKKLAKMEATAPKKTWFEQQSPEYQARVKAEEKYYNTADERYEKNVRGREILHEGHDADLVVETPTRREWVSRVTGEIEREKLVNGRWETDDS